MTDEVKKSKQSCDGEKNDHLLTAREILDGCDVIRDWLYDDDE